MATASDDDVPRVPLDPDVDFGLGDGADPGRRRRRSRQVQTIIVVALAFGGVLGAVSRYALSLALPTETTRFPWGTFLINVSGSAVLGFILVLVIEQFPRGRLARPVIGTGFIGAYTTFSTFMVETVELIRDGRPGTAVAYLAASVLAGLFAVWIGMMSARVVLRAERWLQQEV
ncbi:MAG TPA: fluoride efflux transporter CrcB [Acidimicrobiales bacterium]|nr:fluoride efflux transporter CrcB [Acidimicrobiales bacterium]